MEPIDPITHTPESVRGKSVWTRASGNQKLRQLCRVTNSQRYFRHSGQRPQRRLRPGIQTVFLALVAGIRRHDDCEL
jgi:hypothetical protein